MRCRKEEGGEGFVVYDFRKVDLFFSLLVFSFLIFPFFFVLYSFCVVFLAIDRWV